MSETTLKKAAPYLFDSIGETTPEFGLLSYIFLNLDREEL